MGQPKQYTVGANLSDKTMIAEISKEFTRPGAVKGNTVIASEREVVEIITKVATDARFGTDGKDRFQAEWDAIVERDHAGKGIATADKLKARIAELEAKLAAQA